MRICIVSDAWLPQVNGVVRTLMANASELTRRGHEVEVIGPDRFRSLPCPTYPEIRLALTGRHKVGAMIEEFAPDALHISTEGPLGYAARAWAKQAGFPFTTAFHTHFPDYVAKRTRLPADLFWPIIKRFHAASSTVFAATPSLGADLAERGIGPIHRWSRGVDLARFSPEGPDLLDFSEYPGPIMLNVGRVAIEKNMEAFLSLDLPGTKVVVGDGPDRAELERRYPDAIFLGLLQGELLAAAYRAADVFVFPSRTDTFGLVMIEALACGTPVAAFDVAGPRDVLSPRAGAMSPDLREAVCTALSLNPADCVAHAARFTWEKATDQFERGLLPVGKPAPRPPMVDVPELQAA